MNWKKPAESSRICWGFNPLKPKWLLTKRAFTLTDFVLDPRLAKDCRIVSQHPNWLVMIMDDCRYPWFIIVPRVPNCREWFDLPSELSQQLFDYSQQLGAGIKQAFQCHKINIAALGNVVEQLHIHVIGRQIDDPAWPGPVWGHSPAIPYTEQQLSARLKHLKETTIVNNIL